MSLWILVPLLLLVVILQVTWLPLIPILGLKPDLALVLVTVWGLLAPIGEAAQWGFVLGILLDLTSGLPFGVHTLTLTLVGLLVGLGQRAFFRGNLIAPPVTVILATLFDHTVILGILALLNESIAWSDYLIHITLPTSILNMVLAGLIFFPLQWLYRRLHPQIEVE